MPTIAKYLGDRKGAVSLTFDDGFRGQVANTCEIIDPLGIKGTFFLIPLYMDDPTKAPNIVTWQRARELLAAGHEIGTHGSIKEKLHEADDARLDYLVNESWRLIHQHTGVAPVSYALPGGSRPTERVVATIREHHHSIRVPRLLSDGRVMGYGSTGRRQWDDEKTRQAILDHTGAGGWFVATIHAIVKGYSPFKSKDEFRDHCRWLTSQADTIWTAPLGTVGRYVRARDAATLRNMERGDTSIRFSLTCDLEPAEVYRGVPLTVVIPAPGATEPRATSANGEALEATIRDGNILLDVLPNGAEMTVTWTSNRE